MNTARARTLPPPPFREQPGHAVDRLFHQAEEADIRLTPAMAEGLARGHPRMIAYVADLISLRGRRPAVEPRHDGGAVQPGKTYTVNENGPEAVVDWDGKVKSMGDGRPALMQPQKPAVVLPNNQSIPGSAGLPSAPGIPASLAWPTPTPTPTPTPAPPAPDKIPLGPVSPRAEPANPQPGYLTGDWRQYAQSQPKPPAATGAQEIISRLNSSTIPGMAPGTGPLAPRSAGSGSPPVPSQGDPIMAVPPRNLPQVSKNLVLAERDAAANELAALEKTLPPGPLRTDDQRRQVLELVRRRMKAGAVAHGYNGAIEEQDSSAFKVGAGWLTGAGGEDHAKFLPGSTFQEQLARSPESQRARESLAKILDKDDWAIAGGVKPGVYDSTKYDEAITKTRDQRVLYRDLGPEPKAEYAKGFASDLVHNPTRAYLGSFQGKVTVDPRSVDMARRTAQAVFRATNVSSAESALRAPPPYGYNDNRRSDGSSRATLLPPSGNLVPKKWTNAEDWVPKAVLGNNPLGAKGPMHDRSQDILWSEQIHY